MPVIANAKKALRRDQRRTEYNRKTKTKMRVAIKALLADGKPELLSKAYQTIDWATKKHLLHPNKAARMKSGLAKQVAASTVKPTTKAATKTTKAKKAAK